MFLWRVIRGTATGLHSIPCHRALSSGFGGGNVGGSELIPVADITGNAILVSSEEAMDVVPIVNEAIEKLLTANAEPGNKLAEMLGKQSTTRCGTVGLLCVLQGLRRESDPHKLGQAYDQLASLQKEGT